jgi:hypothetical protein
MREILTHKSSDTHLSGKPEKKEQAPTLDYSFFQNEGRPVILIHP